MPQFGAWLKSLRRGRSYENIALKLRPFVPELKMNRSSVVHLEKGRMPKGDVLRALAVVYQKPFAELAERVMQELGYISQESADGRESSLQLRDLSRIEVAPSADLVEGGEHGRLAKVPTADVVLVNLQGLKALVSRVLRRVDTLHERLDASDRRAPKARSRKADHGHRIRRSGS